jgi:hypothetical protein
LKAQIDSLKSEVSELTGKLAEGQKVVNLEKVAEEKKDAEIK